MKKQDPPGLSSSKCDFRFTFGPVTFKGRRAAGEMEWSGAAPNMNIRVGSDKCDWRILTRADLVSTSTQRTSEYFDLRSRLPNFVSRIGSDKCDFSVSVQRPDVRMRVDSDKCDWQIAARSDLASANIAVAPDFLDLRSRARGFAAGVSSDKCDFRVTAQRLGARTRVASDKCDWLIAAHNDRITVTTQVSSESLNLRGRIGNMAGGVSSSKCDWRIFSQDERVSITTQGTPETFALSGRNDFFFGHVGSNKCDFRMAAKTATLGTVSLANAGLAAAGTLSSSKCDWQVEAIGGAAQLARRPEFDARLSSSKCDFALNIEFGLTGGERVRIRAVSSAKCDFQILDIPGRKR